MGVNRPNSKATHEDRFAAHKAWATPKLAFERRILAGPHRWVCQSSGQRNVIFRISDDVLPGTQRRVGARTRRQMHARATRAQSSRGGTGSAAAKIEAMKPVGVHVAGSP